MPTTPREHALACVAYARYRAAENYGPAESRAVPIATKADLEAASLVRTDFPDACSQEARAAGWFSSQQTGVAHDRNGTMLLALIREYGPDISSCQISRMIGKHRSAIGVALLKLYKRGKVTRRAVHMVRNGVGFEEYLYTAAV
jgi:hypothetical protein